MSADTAFIANGDAGVAIVDVFDPSLLSDLPSLTTPGSVSSLDVAGNRLYAACGTGGLQIYDVTDAGAVYSLGSRATASAARRVRVAGNLAFVACAAGRLEIVNIQNPVVPTLVSTYLGGGSLRDVDVAGNFVVLANTNGALTILNVSNPAVPVAQSTNTIVGGAYGVRVVGNQAYVRNGAGNLVVVPLPALSPTAPQLQEAVQPVLVATGQTAVMSVLAAGTPPATFRWSKTGVPLADDARISGTTNAWLVISNSALTDTGTYSVTVSNALGQIISSNVLTVVNPGAPVVRGSFNPGGTAQGVDAIGFTAYVAAGSNGLEIFDVVDPRHPRRTGGAEVAGFSAGIRILGESGEGVFMATDTNGLQVFKVLPNITPELSFVTNTAGTANAVYLDGGLVYLADGEDGLQVYSLSNSILPTLVGAYDTPGYAWNVFVADGIAYVADGTNGLQILSVTNPAAILPLSTVDTAGETRGVKVAGGKACVADGNGGLLVFNVANPASPTLLGSYPSAVPALDLELADNIVILAKGANGVETFSIANPAAITSLGSASAAAPANGLRIEGNAVYVAAGTNGVLILELVGFSNSFPEIVSSPADVITLPGGAVSFHVGVNGTPPLNYQWFKDGAALFDTSTTHGAATSTLTLSNLILSASGNYSVVVRNAWNLSAATTVNLNVVPVGTPVLRSGFFDPGDALSARVVGQVAFVASRTNGLLAIDCRDPMNPVLVGKTNTLDLAQDVEVHGHYAYVASWKAGLEIFDVLNPTNLVRVGQCDTPGSAHKVRVVGNRAFVADRAGASGSGGFAVIDVSDPTHPGLISTAATTGFAEGLDVLSNTVFVAASFAGMEVFDAANPLAPKQIGQFDTPGNAESVTLVGTRAYVSDYNRGLQVVDVLNPAAPVKFGEFSTSGDAFNLQIVSNRAYVATGIGKAQVVDVANANGPVLISTSLAGKSVRSLQIIGQHAFLADRESGLLVAELLGFSPAAPSIVEFATNISATAGRELVLSVAGEGTPPLSYYWQLNGTPLTNSADVTGVNNPHLRFTNLGTTNSGNYTVVISNAQGAVTSAVAAVTVSAYGAPLARGVFDTPGQARAAAVFGNVAFVADGGATVRLADLTDVNNPTALGTYLATGVVYGVCMETNLLFLALGTNGVEIVDVSNPAQPRHVGAFDTPGTALNLDVNGGVAFVADGEAGLQIFNVTNPASPVSLGSLDTTGTANDVRVAGNLAFVADGSSGLQVITITNLTSPIRIGGYGEGGTANALRIAGNRAYLANGGEGLLILDISTPASPVPLGGYFTEDATALDVVGNLVVLADGIAGYVILDATNPANVIPVGSGPAGDAVTGAALVGNLAFLSSGTNGLKFVELSGVSPVAPAFLKQPVSVAVLHGDTAQFEALATGTPALACHWYLDDLPVLDNTRISGAATPRLVITDVGLPDAGNYTLRVLSPWGVTNSVPAQLRFIGPLQAQIDAAANGAVIQLAAGTYPETLLLNKSVTLVGQWWNQPVLTSVGQDPVLHVLPGASVTLRGLALRGGAAHGANGGGIFNEGSLWLDHCLVADNLADSGAGIANLGTLVLVASVISNNTASASGGGIHNGPGATVLATNCTITANFAQDGAGMFNQGIGVLASSLVSSNFADGLVGNGGGFRSLTGLVQLVNCTVSGNLAAPATTLPATGLGGGFCVNGGVCEFYSSTVAFNAASFHGGGISIAPQAQVHSRNSLFANNYAPDSPDFGGVMYSDGYNLVQNGVGLAFAGTAPGDLWNVDAKLDSLRDNGGPTLTHALLSGSPAIDGAAAPGPATDARGMARPLDIPWIANAANGLDIGAFEFIDLSPYLILSNRTAVGFTLAWATNGVLQKSFSLPTGWVDLTNPSPLFVSMLTNDQSFFRLRTMVAPTVLTTNSQTTNGFVLAWPGAGILEHAPATKGPWEALSGISPFPVVIDPAVNEFFRLRVIEH
ncbi:MAG: immunoglobulin domain-containing protein [Verrucomicrobiota bacterium]